MTDVSLWQVALGGLITSVPVVGTIAAARFSRRTGQEANSTADWSAFTKEQREWTNARLAERDKRIATLEEDVSTLRERFDILEAKYRAAIGYIRRLVSQLRRHVPADALESPPPEIAPDL